MPVTKAIPADAAELNVLINTSYRGDISKKGWTTEADLLDGNRIDEATLTTYLNDTTISILKYTDEQDGQIKACVYLQDNGTELYLGMLSVFPELQAQGIGRLLLVEADAFAQKLNIPFIKITVISTRIELIAWYERRGFKATGEVIPFHVEKKFGIPKKPIELITMTKKV